MHLRSPPQLQSQNPLEGRLPRDYSRSIPISQTPWSIMHPSAWKVNSPKLDFRFTEFSEVQSRIMHRLPLRAARMASKRASARRAACRGPVVTEDGSCSAREVSEPTQRPDAGNEVVVPPTVAHERGKPSQTSADRPLRDGELVVLGVRSDEGVDLLGSADGAAVVDPLLLDELELACDVGIEGHEDESSVGAVVFEQPRFEPGPVGRAAADDAVKPHFFAADDGVARVRAPSVRPNRALQAALVVAVEEVVVAGVVGTERWVVFVRRERERGAAGPASHDLRGDPLGVRLALRGASDVAAESGDIRVELAEDQVAPIAPQGVGLGDGRDAARLVGVAQYELSRFDRLLLRVRGGDPAAFHRGMRDAIAEIEGVAPVLG